MNVKFLAMLGVGLLAFTAGGLVPVRAQSTGAGSAQVKYKVLPLVKLTVVPNYQTGFGPTGGTGSGSTPAVGALATLNSGTVDFGTVVGGYAYLYKFAAAVTVTTNDTSGFIVYAEGSTDLNGSNPVPAPPTFPINQALFWLVSGAGNSPFSAATAFNATSSPVTGGGTSITYPGGVPPPSARIWSSGTAGTVTQGYDYELRLPATAAPAAGTTQFNVFVVYTVVGN